MFAAKAIVQIVPSVLADTSDKAKKAKASSKPKKASAPRKVKSSPSHSMFVEVFDSIYRHFCSIFLALDLN